MPDGIEVNKNSIVMPIATVAAVILGVSSWGFQLYSKNNDLAAGAIKVEIQKNTDAINAAKNSLLAKISELQSKHNELSGKYDSLDDEINQIKSELSLK